MTNLVGSFFREAKSKGLKSALQKAGNYVAQPHAPVAIGANRNDVLGFYKNILSEERGFGLKLSSENLPKGTMTWVIPDFSANSGGHINLARMSKLLQKQEDFQNQHVVIVEPHRWKTAEEAQGHFRKAFDYPNITVSLGADSLEPTEYLFATGWQTAYVVAKYKDAIYKLYFVQDFEPYFYSSGSEYFLAENTYKLGLTGVTAGDWLANKLSKEYGMKTKAYDFACDLDIYYPREKKQHSNRNIFFYARPVTPRRCFELGLLALERVCSKYDDVAVIFGGWDVGNYEIPFKHLNGGEIAISELPELYTQCEASLVLSATNLSLLPLELAACGCPLIINRLENASWLLSENEAEYCEMTVDSITDALEAVLTKPDVAKKKAKKALTKARKSNWAKEAEKVGSFLKSLSQK